MWLAGNCPAGGLAPQRGRRLIVVVPHGAARSEPASGQQTSRVGHAGGGRALSTERYYAPIVIVHESCAPLHSKAVCTRTDCFFLDSELLCTGHIFLLFR